MPIPRNIGFDGVEARIFDLLEPITPQLTRGAEVMKCRAADERVLAFNRQAMAVVANSLGLQKWFLRKLGTLASENGGSSTNGSAEKHPTQPVRRHACLSN